MARGCVAKLHIDAGRNADARGCLEDGLEGALAVGPDDPGHHDLLALLVDDVEPSGASLRSIVLTADLPRAVGPDFGPLNRSWGLRVRRLPRHRRIRAIGHGSLLRSGSRPKDEERY